MASKNSDWGNEDEPELDYPGDTLRGFDNRPPLSNQQSNAYSEYDDNVEPPVNDHRTNSRSRKESDYQRLKSMKRHTEEATYATLTQDF